jgi:hypothetical protein
VRFPKSTLTMPWVFEEDLVECEACDGTGFDQFAEEGECEACEGYGVLTDTYVRRWNKRDIKREVN